MGESKDLSGYTTNPMGVYGYKNGTIRYLGNTSSGKDGSDGTQVKITAIFAISGEEFLIGWMNDTTYGIDYIGVANNRIQSYGAYLISPIYIVGTKRSSSSIEYFDVFLSKELASGEGVRISYRENLTDDFTTIATIDFATYGAISHFTFPKSIPNALMIQVKVELTSTGNSSPEVILIQCQ